MRKSHYSHPQNFQKLSSEPEWFGDNWKMLVAFKSLLEVQRRAAAIDAILMFFYTKGTSHEQDIDNNTDHPCSLILQVLPTVS